MSEKNRYELSVIFHSEKPYEDIVSDVFDLLGQNAGIEMHRIDEDGRPIPYAEYIGEVDAK